jgi:hypothetical protein
MIDSDDIATEIHRQARRLFRDGIAESALVEKSGKVEKPIPIHGADHAIEAWFVGVVVGDKLAGYMRLQNNLTLLGYSSFQRRPDSVDECPGADTWLDPNAVLELARSVTGPNDRLEQPFLGYDKHPSRLAWHVRVSADDGGEKLVLVAGGDVYLA